MNVVHHPIGRTLGTTQVSVARRALTKAGLEEHAVRLPPANAWSITILNQPLGLVGGDFYAISSEGQNCRLVLGDVCGKGQEAFSIVPTILKCFAELRHLGPGARIDRCNTALTGCFTNDAFCTAWCGAFFADGTVTYASAGHEPAILCTTDGSMRLLAVDGVPIGVASSIGGRERSIRMHGGDKLLIYTDGLSECFMRGVLRREDLFDDLHRAKAVLRERDRRDDILALLVEFRPSIA
jgi:serine phosphatase RsbU (regulator of sigma subunit)